MRSWLAVAAFFGVLAFQSPAQALCLVCTCTVAPSVVSFGNFEPLNNSNLDMEGTVSVNCFGVAVLDSFAVKLGAGIYGTVASRQMRSGANALNYNLYKETGRSTIWGDGTGGYTGKTFNNTLSLLTWSSNVTVYGRIPPAPLTRAGNYSDTVVVTIEW